jgi:hypothetical protein
METSLVNLMEPCLLKARQMFPTQHVGALFVMACVMQGAMAAKFGSSFEIFAEKHAACSA